MQSDKIRLSRAFPTRLELLVGFSVLVALFVAALALGVGYLLRQSIIESSLKGAEQTGRVFAELELGVEEYKKNGELTNAAPHDLDAVVRRSSTLQAVRIWDTDHELVYSSKPEPPSSQIPSDDALRTALGGEAASVVSTDQTANGPGEKPGSERVLGIYLPITLADDPAPRSVLELHMPYAPVQAKIEGGNRGLAAVLGLGALLFYCGLLPSVLRASRALADLQAARQAPLQRRLRQAMRDGELALAYQPKLDLRSGTIEAVEALLRWRLPDGQTVPPAEFIPLVEPTAVMGELTMHVFELALAQSAAWTAEGIEVDIAVNISACDLRDDTLPDRLAERTAAYGLTPGRFTLELTEGAVSQSPDHDLRTLAALRARGFSISIDDFGTGESSLSRIRTAEFQEVKIDRSFIQHLDEEQDPALVAGIIDLGQALGARVVAEGVESEAAARRLEALGCDVIQGFHLAHPQPPAELARWLRRFPSGTEAHPAARPATT